MTARVESMADLSLPDMERRIANAIRYGTIMAVDLAKRRVRVKSGDIESTWLPWPAGRAGAGKRRWDPPEVGEQVVMLSPSGDLRQAAVIPGLYQDTHDSPSSSADKDHVTYGDGTTIEYDRGSHTLVVDLGASKVLANRDKIELTIGSTKLTLTASGAVLDAQQCTVNSQQATVNATTAATVVSPAVTLNTPTTTMTGNLVVAGSITFGAGLIGTGVGGPGNATINGNVTVNGNVSNTGTLTNNGKSVGSTHTHSGVSSGSGTSGAPT
jgi:phage baseplate assembly protein V